MTDDDRVITLLPCETCRASGMVLRERESGRAATQVCIRCWGVGLRGVRWGQSPREDAGLHVWLLAETGGQSEALCQLTVATAEIGWDVVNETRCPRCQVLLGKALTAVHGGRDRWVWNG